MEKKRGSRSRMVWNCKQHLLVLYLWVHSVLAWKALERVAAPVCVILRMMAGRMKRMNAVQTFGNFTDSPEKRSLQRN